jgi:tRNA (mo5U34)-methyltransferase
VGANNGYFSVEAVRRGARKIVALYQWATNDIRCFELVRQYIAPSIEATTCDVMDLRSNPIGRFDCVLFLGVLYHLKHPLYVLETLFELTLERLVIETAIDLNDYDRPAMVFYPGLVANNDPTNWWGPNVRCVMEMMTTVGFSRVEYTPILLVKKLAHSFTHSNSAFRAGQTVAI